MESVFESVKSRLRMSGMAIRIVSKEAETGRKSAAFRKGAVDLGCSLRQIETENDV